MRPHILRFALPVALLAAAACSDSTGPQPPLNEAGLQADLGAAQSAASAPASVSFAALGDQISLALGDGSFAFRLSLLAPAMTDDAVVLLRDGAARARLMESAATPSPAAIPAAALGRTFTYNAELGRYEPSDIPGAPANGVRFILYQVDPETGAVVLPLVQVGQADLTRTVANDVATARVQVYSVGAGLVLDYATTVSGSAISPKVVVSGFAKNAADSLTFTLSTAVSALAETITLTWRSEVPTRDLVTRITQVLSSSNDSFRIAFDGVIRSGSGNVGIKGTVLEASGGTLTVRVNGDVFARITLPTGELEQGTITGPDGQPLTPEREAMLRQILEWFAGAFVFFLGLLTPVQNLLDVAF